MKISGYCQRLAFLKTEMGSQVELCFWPSACFWLFSPLKDLPDEVHEIDQNPGCGLLDVLRLFPAGLRREDGRKKSCIQAGGS
jgi:hypothetical protein